MKFSEFAERYIRTYVMTNSKRTGAETKAHSLRKHIVPFFGDTDLKDIDTLLVEDFIVHLTNTPSARMKGKMLSNKSINNLTGILGHMLKRAHRNKLMPEMPYIDRKRVEVKETPRLMMPEIEALLLADIPARTKQMLVLLIFTGMRIGEVRALAWKNIHLDKGYIDVCQSCPQHSLIIEDSTKTGQDYKTPIAPALKQVLESFHGKTGLVFENLGAPGIPLRYDVYNDAITRACEIAGIRRVTPHAFRHTNISMHVADAKNGAGLVRFFVGHSDIRMTQRYIGRDQNLDTSAMTAFEALFPVDMLQNLKNSVKSRS